MKKKQSISDNSELLESIRQYWNEHIHDLEVARHPAGSREFFDELEAYRFEKLHYLPRLVDFNGFRNQSLLEIGCGAGIDLVRFARGQARVTGIDLAETSVDLARKNFAFHGVKGRLETGNGECLVFGDSSFDVVYAHGVIQYTAGDQAMVDEIHRVLKPGGMAILMVYNRRSWLNFLSRALNVKMEHTDAPVLKKYSRREFSRLLAKFSRIRIVTERFPVRSRLQKGTKAIFFNRLFVPVFNAIPRVITRRTGWHLMAFVWK